MKLLFLAVFVTVFTGCSNTSPKMNAETLEVAEKHYVLINREYTHHVKYNPLLAKNPNCQHERDLFFSKELLRALESSLTKYSYEISINNEVICSPENDTISVTVYDFIGKTENITVKKLFEGTTFIVRSINILPPPYSALYFMNGKNLCVVVMERISLDPTLKSDLFMEYIKEEIPARLPDSVAQQ